MKKQVLVLAILVFLALDVSVWLIQKSTPNPNESSPLFGELGDIAHAIDKVEIENAQGIVFHGKKFGDRWIATFDPELAAYPVAQRKLAEFTQSLAQADVEEAKTNKPEKHIRLGLQSIDVTDSLATLVRFTAGAKSWQVLVGNKASLGDGSYVRKPDQSQSWRTEKSFILPVDKFSWLQQPILPFKVKDIGSVSRVDKQKWQIIKNTSTSNFELKNMPQDKDLQYPSILNALVSSVTNLNFEQLAPIDPPLKNLQLLTQLEITITAGEVFQVVLSRVGDRYYANFTSTRPEQMWQKWYYQLSSFSAEQLIKTVDDFLIEKI
jgi:hypothetical protein